MTENEIKEATLEDAIYCAKAMACIEVCEECRFYGLCHTWCDDVYRIIIDALEEVQAYRAIGTVEDLQDMKNKYQEAVIDWRQYRKVGTIEEFKALKEKNNEHYSDTEELDGYGYSCTNKTCNEIIRNKVIDEFAEKLNTDVESFVAEVDGVRADLLTLDYFSEFVFEVAEKLKGVQE